MEELQSDPAWGEDRSLKAAESLRALREQADQTLDSHRRHISEFEARLNEQLQQISDELARDELDDQQASAAAAEQAAQLDQLRHTVIEKEAEVEELLDQLTSKSLEFESQLAERDEELEQILELNETENQQLTALQQELESARQALEELRAQECEACVTLRAELAAAQQQLTELGEQFDVLQQRYEAQQAELDDAQQATQSAQLLSQQSVAALDEAEKSIADLRELQRESQQSEAQLEQTRRKFELALADVHKLKRENAELHEELLSRPAADAQESPELVSLRAERDALANRISEIENTPAPTATTDEQQELEDLQRRFEMAVDEVRQLKQSSADLRQQLETAQTIAPVISGDEAQDWQAQKARLLASLDAEDQGAIDESRREQRATIEGTLSITDRVVAEKDFLLAKKEAEITALQVQLEERPAGIDLDALRDQIASEILGDDEAVQAECKKLQQQQRDLDAKLREAELEISVQRATLAREHAAVDEKLARLSVADGNAKESPDNKPRRRWLSALGIKDEEDE